MKTEQLVAAVLTLAAAAVAAAEVNDPFNATVHTWWFALAVAVAGAYLLFRALATVLTRKGDRRLALASLGGALLAGSVVMAAFLVGQPERVPAAPGQVYRPPHGRGIAVDFPPAPAAATSHAAAATPQAAAASTDWPDSVTIDDAGGSMTVRSGDTVRVGAFAFRVVTGPMAYIDARTLDGKPVTVTQPAGAAFLSPYLTFGGLDGAQPEDYFAVPALHRTVQVDYWAGLPSRGIDVPFLVLRIAEENGGPLFEGVAVSGKTLRKAGVALTFSIGSFPVVTASSAPPLIPFFAGAAMVGAGWIAYAVAAMRGRRG